MTWSQWVTSPTFILLEHVLGHGNISKINFTMFVCALLKHISSMMLMDKSFFLSLGLKTHLQNRYFLDVSNKRWADWHLHFLASWFTLERLIYWIWDKRRTNSLPFFVCQYSLIILIFPFGSPPNIEIIFNFCFSNNLLICSLLVTHNFARWPS